jgi:hypothetical protein
MKKTIRSFDPYPDHCSVGFYGIIDNVREAIADLEDAAEKELIAYASRRWGARMTKAQFERAIRFISLVP